MIFMNYRLNYVEILCILLFQTIFSYFFSHNFDLLGQFIFSYKKIQKINELMV